MSRKFTIRFYKFFLILLVLIIGSFLLYKNNSAKISENILKKKPQEISSKENIKIFPYRRYLHVKEFYMPLAKKSIEIGLKYNVPPAAILAMAGVESGYGSGYVSKITGNILSLGAKKGEKELPSLYLPHLKSDKSKILYSTEKIAKYNSSELVWKQRAKSLKKDYRPQDIAGTKIQLDYFDRKLKQKRMANLQNIEDFAKDWIAKGKRLKPFVKARAYLDKQVSIHSKDILFDEKLNEDFIKIISGKPNSFNYRTTWAPKVISVMNKIGMVKITQILYKSDKKLSQVW